MFVQYQLETFTERRENSWSYTAFSAMTEIDGPDNGTAPLPWDIAVTPRGMFEAEVKTLWVPHTSAIKHCFRCISQGSVPCQECHAKGWVSFDIKFGHSEGNLNELYIFIYKQFNYIFLNLPGI